MLKRFIDDDGAATSIEYGLIAMIVSVGVAVAAMGVSDELRESFHSTAVAFEEIRTPQ